MTWQPVNSQLNTVFVPQLGTNPALLYSAAERPLRIVIRNVGGPVVFLSHDATSLNQAPVLAGTFQLPSGSETVIVLMPRQGISAGAAGAGGLISMAISEAIPYSMGA